MKDKEFRYSLNDFDGSWADEEENLKKLGVIYKSGWCHGFKVNPRGDINPLIEMLVEDDGTLFSTGERFDLVWAKSIIEALQETIKYCEENNLYKLKR